VLEERASIRGSRVYPGCARTTGWRVEVASNPAIAKRIRRQLEELHQLVVKRTASHSLNKVVSYAEASDEGQWPRTWRRRCRRSPHLRDPIA